MNTHELARLIESFAPLYLQESWDNSGYNLDLHNSDIRNVLICLDVTDTIVDEAISRQCGVIISHHPLLFHETRRIDSGSYHGSLIARLVQANISVYCAHTTMDSSPFGVNRYVANMLGLKNVTALAPARGAQMYKLAVTVPRDHADAVRSALFSIGAGALGNYSECSFTVEGMGTFRPLKGSDPFMGTTGQVTRVDELMIQVLVPEELREKAVEAVTKAHPYEVPALDVYKLYAGDDPESGMGAIGDLACPCALRSFAEQVKLTLRCPVVMVVGSLSSEVHRAALCTGAGIGLARTAASQGAQVLVTGEAKHNEYAECGHELSIITAGHYDTEKWFVDAMSSALQAAGLEIKYKVGVCVSADMQRPYLVI